MCMCVHTSTRARKHTCAQAHLNTYACPRTCTHTHTHTHTHKTREGKDRLQCFWRRNDKMCRERTFWHVLSPHSDKTCQSDKTCRQCINLTCFSDKTCRSNKMCRNNHPSLKPVPNQRLPLTRDCRHALH